MATRVHVKLNERRSNVTRRLRKSLIFNKFQVFNWFCCSFVVVSLIALEIISTIFLRCSKSKCFKVVDDVEQNFAESHHIIAIIVFGDCKSKYYKNERQNRRLMASELVIFVICFWVEVGVSWCCCEKQETLIQFWCCPAMNAPYLIDFWLQFEEAG